jgi:hypothetical protein
MAVKMTPTYEPDWSIEVRRAAAQVAVEASKKTGHPVHPRVKELAEEADRLEGRIPEKPLSRGQRIGRRIREILFGPDPDF